MNNPELGQVFTSSVIADYMVSLFDIDKHSAVLDPCFGGGAFLEALERASFHNVTGYEIDEYWYSRMINSGCSENLYLEDFLTSDDNEKFDGIIMNPPYIRQEKIDHLSELGINKETLQSDDLYKCLPKTANLYMFFIVKAISLLKDGGEMVAIFPSSWMFARGGKSFKKYIDSHVCVTKQIDVYGEVFEGDVLVEVSILKMVKAKDEPGSSVEKYKVFKGMMIKEEFNEISGSFTLPVKFKEYASVRRGITTGYNDAFINPISGHDLSRYLIPIISSPKNIEGFKTDNAKTDLLLCIKHTVDVDDVVNSYLKSVEQTVVKNRSPKTIYEKIKQNRNWYTLNAFPCEGILFSYFVRNDMKFVMNTAGTMIRDNFYILYPKIDPYLMFALLNNYYTYYQLEQSGKKYGAGLLKIQRYDIEDLTFPDIKRLSDSEIDKLISLSKELVSTGNKLLVARITELLANQNGESFEMIKDAYLNKKNNRLESV